MQQHEIVTVLREMADLLEVTEANTFEVMAYRNGAQALDEWNGDLSEAASSGTLEQVPAIGKSLAKLVTDLVASGTSEELTRVRGLVPEQLPTLLKVRGLGPKRVRALWRELDVCGPDDLRRAAEEGRVQQLRGFGAKSVERILAGLDYLEQPRPSASAKAAVSIPMPAARSASGRVLAGISGYSYASWKGTFYPEDASSDSFLSLYAERLSTVEINNTFYRFPSEKVIDQWRSQTPEGFSFSVKAHRRFTHQLRLAPSAREGITEFVERCGKLGDQLGCVLFQLPPNLSYDPQRLNTLMTALPAGPRYAVEFRHDSWLTVEVIQRLTDHNIAMVCRDDVHRQVTGDFVYARLPAELEETEIDAWQKWFQSQTRTGRDVLVYFKHDDDGNVPHFVASRWGKPSKRKLAASKKGRTQQRKRG